MNLVSTEQSPSPRRRWLILGSFLLAVLILAGGGLTCLRGRQPRLLASVPGKIIQLKATAAGLFWIEWADGGSSSASNSALRCLARPGGSPALLLQGCNLLRLDTEGNTLFVLEGGPRSPEARRPYPQGRLLQMAASGGSPLLLLQGLVNPGDLWVDREAIYWTETYPTPAPPVTHVPPLQYLTLIRTCPRSGGEARQVRLLAQVEGSEPTFQGQLLGVEEGFLYWLERRYLRGEEGTSFVRRVALSGGPVETLAVSKGRQTAAVGGSAVYCTAYSVEAAPPSAYWVVYRYPLTGADRQLLTDWLYSAGQLLWRESKLYYADRNGLWQVPLRWGPPRQLDHQLMGARQVDVHAGFFYAARSGGQGPQASTQVLRRPVALMAWIRNALER